MGTKIGSREVAAVLDLVCVRVTFTDYWVEISDVIYYLTRNMTFDHHVMNCTFCGLKLVTISEGKLGTLW